MPRIGLVNAADPSLKAAYETVGGARREALRLVPQMPLYPDPPTVALGAGNAATALSGATVDVDKADPLFRFTGCNGTVPGGGGGWYLLGATPNGSDLDQGAPYFVDWVEDSADFEIKLAGQANFRGYRLWVDGQPLTSVTQAGPGATADTHRLRLTFTSRAARHIRILTNAGWVGVTHGATDTAFAATRPLYSRRAYFLGDSFTSGSGTDYQQDGYVWQLADRMGWEPMMGGELGTGYTTAGSGTGGRNTFPNRATTDAAPTGPDLVVVYGGTNDYGVSPATIQVAAATTFANLAAALPGVPVYVFGCQYPTGASDTTRDGIDAAIKAAALAAPNVKLFTSVKGWMTGTGNSGAPAGDGNADVLTYTDGLHPTSAGHAYLAARMAAALTPTYTA